MTCPLPPKGWTCSRAKGHDGPCAASPEEMPYEKYVDKVIDGLPRDWYVTGEFRRMLIDAWFAGLEHSLVLMEKK